LGSRGAHIGLLAGAGDGQHDEGAEEGKLGIDDKGEPNDVSMVGSCGDKGLSEAVESESNTPPRQCRSEVSRICSEAEVGVSGGAEVGVDKSPKGLTRVLAFPGNTHSSKVA
jgi:hypothetical protein